LNILVRRKTENALEHVLPLYVARITERTQRGRVKLEALRLSTRRARGRGGGAVDGGQEGESRERQNRIDGGQREMGADGVGSEPGRRG
jgi:hypothetical protein